MNSVFPASTLFNPERTTGRDFLGQQSIIQYMADRCLPSFTNATRKIRYYSFWAWAFKMLETYGQKLDEKQKWWYLLKLETVLIIINKYLDPELVGMPGVTGIPYTVDEITKFVPDTIVKIYDEKNRATSYDPVQYAPSLGTLNIVKKIGTKISICNFGQELFKEFDNKIETASGYSLLLSPNTKDIKWAHLLEMKEGFSLENISENERKILIRIIEQQTISLFSKRGKTERIETTLMVLDIIKKEKVKENEDILKKLWNGEYESPQELKQIADGWKIIEARRFYQISIEAILSAFCQYLCSFKGEPGDFDEFSIEVTDSFKKLRHSGTMPFNHIIEKDEPLKNFIEAVNEYCSEHDIDEQDLIDLIKKYSGDKQTFNFPLVQSGLILLLYLFTQFESLKALETEKAEHFWRTPTNFRHSFELVDRLIRKWSGLPVSTGLKNIVQHLSLRLHLGVSQDKWLQTGNFTFRYIKDDPNGFKLLNTMRPNRTGNKLLSYTELITGLGFIDKSSEYLKLTKDGYSFLGKHEIVKGL
jgi:hypothetical protein